MSDLTARANRARDNLRTSLWPVPAAGVVAALVAGVVLPRLDASFGDALPGWLTILLFGGGAGAARTVLDAIASSLITVTSLTFSLTVVTLQLASSQFSPRLLRSFTRDRVVHATLALFLGTFTYSLTVLRTIRSADESASPFVPQISVTTAFLLATVSVIALVTFLSHLARQIRVETVLAQVHAEATTSTTKLLGRHAAVPADAEVARSWLPPPLGRARDTAMPGTAVLPATGSGFVVHIDELALLEAARRADAVVVVERSAGDHVVAGTPIGTAYPTVGGSFAPEVLAQLRSRVQESLACGPERTGVQDVGFGLRQLTDVAVKALSPGINDPTTAVHALNHSAALLCELAEHELGPVVLREDDDDDGERDRGAVPAPVRVVLARPRLDDLLELAVAQPRRYGTADPEVLARLFELLRELAWCGGPAARPAVADQLLRLRATSEAQDFDEQERTRLAVLAAQAGRAADGCWDAVARDP